MLFAKEFWPGIEDGSVTMTFRRWKRRHVVVGNRYRTAAGILQVESVDVVDPDDVTDREARRAGFADAASLLARLRDDPALPVYRIVFHRVDEPDPRHLLAHADDLDAEDVAEITRRLDRLDRASTRGWWTGETLALIAANPERRAPDLAAMVGRETAPFKRDVRKLKNLGLTLSFRVGYRLSPRGRAYLDAVE